MDPEVRKIMDQIEAALQEACQHTLDEQPDTIVIERCFRPPVSAEYIKLRVVISNTSNSPCTSKEDYLASN